MIWCYEKRVWHDSQLCAPIGQAVGTQYPKDHHCTDSGTKLHPHCKMPAAVYWILWLCVCTVEGNGDVLSIFIYTWKVHACENAKVCHRKEWQALKNYKRFVTSRNLNGCNNEHIQWKWHLIPSHNAVSLHICCYKMKTFKVSLNLRGSLTVEE